jgi:ligand-binding sensor domain-containing protein/DNA-binding CsgD family transcriptional regulator
MMVLWLLLTEPGWGQATGPTLYVDHLTISDGLSHNTVYCFLQDRDGYFWVGTQYGLNQYDGYAFEVIRPEGEGQGQAGFSGKKITALFEDRAGNLWVGTGKHGINYRPALSDRFVNRSQEAIFAAIQHAEISSFFEDQAGYIWITTIGAGLLRYDPVAETARHYTSDNSGLSSNLVFDLVEDQYGTIWVGTAGGGLNVLGADHRFQLSHPMLPNHPNMSGYHKKLLLDGEYLWVGTEGTGLYRMNLQDHTYDHFAPGNGKKALSSDGVRDMYKTQHGQLYIATDGGGLNVYDSATETVVCYPYQVEEKTGLNSNALLCLSGDRTGNIWIGTYNGGINIHKPGKVWFKRYAPGLAGSNTLQNRSILSLLQGQDGKIWVGSDGGGLNWIQPEDGQFDAPPFKHDPASASSLAGNVVKALFEDSRRRLWVGLFGAGLDRYEPGTGTFAHVLAAPNNVWSIAERQNGQLWVATMGNGLVVLDPETGAKTFHQHDPADPGSLVDLNVMVVFVDREDRVWVGTADQGLERWDEAQQAFEHYRHDPTDPQSISNNAIRTIFQDRQGNIWIGTEGGGLNKWLGQGKFERLGQAEGLIANSVMGIAEDPLGMLWVTTFEGISRFDPEARTFRNFDFRTPEHANQFNQLAILSAANGTLFFGGINGLNTIHPDQLEACEHQAEVIFTDLKIFNQSIKAGKLPSGRTILERPIEVADRIYLSYLDKSFSFEFSAIDYTNPLDYQYRYRMKGFDDHWQETAAGQHSVSYTNLDPGHYTFQVEYQQEMASVEVYIEPPFWQTSWFRGLMALLVISLVSAGGYVIMMRKEAAHKRQLLQLQNEKLASEVEAKTSKLMFSAVQIAHKNEILADLKQDLLTSNAELKPLVRKLDLELRNEDHWQEFDIYFNQVDQDFFQSLLAKHPELTKNDLRTCSLIRINLSTKEIAFLLNISTRAVEQGRYRLKKRLGLEKEDDLNKYITGFKQKGLS